MQRRYGWAAVVVVALVIGACSDTAPPPSPATDLEADFSWEHEYENTGPTSCPVARTRFTDESRGDPSVWEWSFPDGASSTDRNPVVEGGVNGDVTLTISADDTSESVTTSVTYAVC